MKKVNVLMPLYNGEKYIREQLDSLVNQTYKNIDIYFRDDGSTDNTLKIIREYSTREFNGIRFIEVKSNGINLGYPDCFWQLVQESKKADYYSFCDQDDVWELNKIESAVACLENLDSNKPAMCFCNFDYYDGNMNFLRESHNYQNEKFDFQKGMFYTFAPGFSQTVNSALIECIDLNYLINKNIAHDLWCQWVALALGKVVYDETVLAKYRRHDNAVTSANQNIFLSIKRWWKYEINGSEMQVWRNCLAYFYYSYEDKLNKIDERKLNIFVKNKNNIYNMLKKVLYPHRFRPSLGGELALRIIFALKKC